LPLDPIQPVGLQFKIPLNERQNLKIFVLYDKKKRTNAGIYWIMGVFYYLKRKLSPCQRPAAAA
jgi:hypothetical protein